MEARRRDSAGVQSGLHIAAGAWDGVQRPTMAATSERTACSSSGSMQGMSEVR